MKYVTIRWMAHYETIVQIKEGLSDLEEEQAISRASRRINIEVEDSEYQEDTWEVEKIIT